MREVASRPPTYQDLPSTLHGRIWPYLVPYMALYGRIWPYMSLLALYMDPGISPGTLYIAVLAVYTASWPCI